MSNLPLTHIATRAVHAYPAKGPIGVAGTAPSLDGWIVVLDGRERWVSAAQFEASYASTGAMSFDHAVHALFAGNRVARKAWPDGVIFVSDGAICLEASGGKYQSRNWRPDKADFFARDWMVVP
ncbi:Protein of unknown function [Devosia crocina]|uniref:Thoeris anti-defense 2-like domain-containing protein n=1 Tax=Devosia crocina TaxID=429728 RepID=A0A1I7N9F3_9HYPH|nr:MW1434 family type I TA system toxin [Devosia crocina]SFV31279.1 Protein of unknown function [Devosia crocina]